MGRTLRFLREHSRISLVSTALVLSMLAPALAEARPQDGSSFRYRVSVPAGELLAGRADRLLASGAGFSRVGGSDRVRAMQRELRALGYTVGPVDGLFGPLTEAAVRAFQQDSGMRVDGITGPRTLHRLVSRVDRLQAFRTRAGERLSLGGAERVRHLQRQLLARGYAVGSVDGLFGPLTERAVRRLERDTRRRALEQQRGTPRLVARPLERGGGSHPGEGLASTWLLLALALAGALAVGVAPLARAVLWRSTGLVTRAGLQIKGLARRLARGAQAFRGAVWVVALSGRLLRHGAAAATGLTLGTAVHACRLWRGGVERVIGCAVRLVWLAGTVLQRAAELVTRVVLLAALTVRLPRLAAGFLIGRAGLLVVLARSVLPTRFAISGALSVVALAGRLPRRIAGFLTSRYLSQLSRLRLGKLFARFGRFGVVGATGLVVNMLLIAVLADVAGLYYVAAAIIATQGSTLWNFVLTETWVFGDRTHRRSLARRAAMFLLVNNAALPARLAILFALTSGLGVHYLLSNFVSLISLTVLRYALADLWIWAHGEERSTSGHCYDIHGIVTVASEVRLPELERFRVAELLETPEIEVSIGRVRPESPNGESPAAGSNGHLAPEQNGRRNGSAQAQEAIRYTEGLGPFGFGIEIVDSGGRVEVLASPLLRHSPHVLYTNVVEPILRWTFAERGYALVHAACFADGERAFMITARTDTGKTTTTLKTLDRHPYSFLSDDLTIVCRDGRVLTYPKPLTISRHTVQAVRTPLLSRRERFGLIFQSRLHSRSGRRLAMLIAKLHIPAATLNAFVQLVVPPPKYHVERLVPQAEITPEAQLAGLVVIQRGGTGEVSLAGEEALEILMSNCEDAYGFPPYAQIEGFLHSRNGHRLKLAEREIVAQAISKAPATLLRSETMDWWARMPALINGGGGGGATPNGTGPFLQSVQAGSSQEENGELT